MGKAREILGRAFVTNRQQTGLVGAVQPGGAGAAALRAERARPVHPGHGLPDVRAGRRPGAGHAEQVRARSHRRAGVDGHRLDPARTGGRVADALRHEHRRRPGRLRHPGLHVLQVRRDDPGHRRQSHRSGRLPRRPPLRQHRRHVLLGR